MATKASTQQPALRFDANKMLTMKNRVLTFLVLVSFGLAFNKMEKSLAYVRSSR
jgi:hypothetical protein